MSENKEAELRAEIIDLEMRLGTIKTGLEAVQILLGKSPLLTTPINSLIETMIKIVDE